MSKRVPPVRPPPGDKRPKNKLLACLPADDFARLRPYLMTIPITVKQVLHRRNEPVREVYFPNGGVASLTTAMKDGAMVEIATVGDEGLVGIVDRSIREIPRRRRSEGDAWVIRQAGLVHRGRPV